MQLVRKEARNEVRKITSVNARKENNHTIQLDDKPNYYENRDVSNDYVDNKRNYFNNSIPVAQLKNTGEQNQDQASSHRLKILPLSTLSKDKPGSGIQF